MNVNQPTEEDIAYIKSSFRFHPLVIQSITSPTLHPTLEAYRNHLFLILHFPVIYRDNVANLAVEMDFLITKKLLITVTYQTHPKLEEFFERLSRERKLKDQLLNHGHTGKLVYGIIDWMLGSLIHDLDFLEERVTRIEEEIFEQSHRGPLVEEISHTRRDILDFKRTIAPLQTVLHLLPETAAKFYGEEMRPYFVSLLASESKTRHLIENHKETIEALQQTNESLIQNKLSRILRLLTIFSAIILPLNFIASIWGMNHRFLPFRDGPYDFWIVASAMAAIAILLIFYFLKKRWL